ncbi:MAG: glycosyltransferase family 4 protein [Bacteroidetes bacterium]|nr:MAG: group 1 glycosyl transferase [Bacteroidetes bacterium OLB10]MBX3105861.1 glycosyltransferase family 4 protein [Bacteroidota bacterium]MCB8929743.1 glycosyltransferase family 4 protein [Bacteroidia bacterium]MCB0849254.1 glycosyltransferase family 4 protein [Bacteroidota bacterium]MCO5288715.1 glycosyltransferase family 4 protein [Bacteroidota bacterium]
MKPSVCLILSFHDRAVQYEWFIEKALEQQMKLHFIFLNPEQWHIERYVRHRKIPCLFIKYNSKKDIPRATALIYQYLFKNKIDIVHTHLFDANISGLTAAWLARVKKRIYTRHHSDFHHRFHRGAVKYDRYCNRLATDIVAISKNVEEILINTEQVKKSKVHLIHHGFELDAFKNVNTEEVEQLRVKYNLKDNHPVVGMISRYEKGKGIQHVIPAFQKLLKEYPNAVLVLANSHGSYAREIKAMLKQLPDHSYREIRFEYNLFALYKLFDVFVHVPEYAEYEAFGQVYVEALAAGVPSVFTLSGIALEFIEDRKNALVCKYGDSSDIYNALSEILSDSSLRELIISEGRKSIAHKFSMNLYFRKLLNLYNYTD